MNAAAEFDSNNIVPKNKQKFLNQPSDLDIRISAKVASLDTMATAGILKQSLDFRKSN